MNGPNWKDLQPGTFYPNTPHRFTLAGVSVDGGALVVTDRGPLSRQLTIVQVCIDPEDGEALFVNAAGLVVPCSPGRNLMRHLERVGKVVAHSTIVGDGRFAKKPHVVDAMKKAGTLQRWVVCRLPLPSGSFFHDQQQEWADYLRREAAGAALDIWAMGGPGDGKGWDGRRDGWGEPAHGEALQLACIRSADEWAAELKAQHNRVLAHDAEVAAYLRGDWPTPPLFQVAAA